MTLPRGVIALGLVSFTMDLSSEMIHSILPLFLVTSLGASPLSVGVIEGIAEATAAITKIFSGVISDRVGRRKPLVLLGYGMAALSKPLFPLATGAVSVLAARFIDRVGKGIRGAPRDALIADITPVTQRGAAYGLRQTLDTVGAFAGPVVAMTLMALTRGDFRIVFWVALIPALLCVLLIAFGVEEPESTRPAATPHLPIRRENLRRLDRRFWWIVLCTLLLTLARFSEAFLLLRAQDVGVAVTWVPSILIVMNIVYASTAYPIGRLADRVSRRGLLTGGVFLLIASHTVLAMIHTPLGVVLGGALWGVHMGATQGLLSAMVADVAPGDLRGTAFGVFNLLSGAGLLAASVSAGWLWSWGGPSVTFGAGALLSTIALLSLWGGRFVTGVESP